jgi:hypothetical protein
LSSFTQPSLQISLPRPHFPLTLFVPIKRHCDVFIWFQDIDIRSVVPVDVTKYNATGGGSYLIVFHVEQSNEACWRYIDRYREVAHDRLMHDYFNDSYVYPPLYLCRRYHMRRNLFLHILERLGEHSSYSTLRSEVVDDNGSPPTRSAQLPYVCLHMIVLLTLSMSTSKWRKSSTLWCLKLLY